MKKFLILSIIIIGGVKNLFSYPYKPKPLGSIDEEELVYHHLLSIFYLKIFFILLRIKNL
jgi:hypothetical protein